MRAVVNSRLSKKITTAWTSKPDSILYALLKTIYPTTLVCQQTAFRNDPQTQWQSKGVEVCAPFGYATRTAKACPFFFLLPLPHVCCGPVCKGTRLSTCKCFRKCFWRGKIAFSRVFCAFFFCFSRLYLSFRRC